MSKCGQTQQSQLNLLVNLRRLYGVPCNCMRKLVVVQLLIATFRSSGEEMGKIMKGITAGLGVAMLTIALAGCAASHDKPRSTATVAISPHRASTGIPSARSVPPAITNERLFADAMAASIPDVPEHAVSGPVMLAYSQFEHAYGAAWGAIGRPEPGESVGQITDGFKLCWPDTGTGPGCDTFNHFTTNQAGQITGLSVNGESVAGRIASAPTTTSGGLTINDVEAYKLADSQNVVVVAFKLTDSSYRPVNTSPALLASLGGASDDTNKDALPSTLAPGDALYAAAGFDVAQTTGLFCLQPNDGLGEHLPCTALGKI